jgi:xanthine dehydrogenase YagR molybdenum-binding subunit
VRLGDSDYPVSSGSGGQWGGNSSTAGVYAACVKLREQSRRSSAWTRRGRIRRTARCARAAARCPCARLASGGDVIGEDKMEYGDLDKKFQQSTFGGHFVEVGVDAATAEIRVRRMLAVCAAGPHPEPEVGAQPGDRRDDHGRGRALMEDLVVDKRIGFFVNHDLAGYEVPVHADIPHQEVIFLDETDPMSSPMKAKGVGELGICGVGAAVANAIYNATGVRVRDYPVTLDKLLPKMPRGLGRTRAGDPARARRGSLPARAAGNGAAP